MLGNGVIGVLSESSNLWERRAPLTPSHCARLLHSGKGKSGIERIIVQPSTRRIFHDSQYEDVGCEISDDLYECGLILGVKQPMLDVILENRAYAFFSHTHKAQKENMPLLDKILAQRASLYDYELIVGENGKRLLAFGKFAGRAGLIDFLHGLGKRYLSLGYSTPFLSLGASYMYPSLAAAKAAVIAVGEEIAAQGLPAGISPIVFVFTGTGNVSQGAQEIFKLLPHTFIDVSKLPEAVRQAGDVAQRSRLTRRSFQVYGCVVTCQDFVEPKDPTKTFNKVDYYAHPVHYSSVFHQRVAPYASVIVNCMYWEKRFPRLLSTQQMQDLAKKGCHLIGVSDITCDIGGSIEFINKSTSIENPFFRYNPTTDSYHEDMNGDGLICLAIDILPTEFSRESSQHFGDILSQFVGSLAWAKNLTDLPSHLRRACIAHGGALTSFYEYIPRMRNSYSNDLIVDAGNFPSSKRKYSTMVSLSGHLFDQFLINEALDVIEAAGGSFRLVKCEVGQSTNAMSYSELEVSADDISSLDQISESLTLLAKSSHKDGRAFSKDKEFILKVGKVNESIETERNGSVRRPAVLVLGAGMVCKPAAELLASAGDMFSNSLKRCESTDAQEEDEFEVIVASLYQKDAEETIEGIVNARAVQLDVADYESLSKYVSKVLVVLSLLPPSFHATIAELCIEQKRHLVTASYVDHAMSLLNERAKDAGVTILCEMGLDPGIDHMMAMQMINQAHVRKGKVRSFTSYCGGLPSPAAADNPLAYKFSWSPAGAIRAGRNPATYKYLGEVVNVDGNDLFDSAVSFRIPDLPAFALEYIPNRNSLVYGDLYAICAEASTIFRATLRYEGFSEIMACLGKIGFFDTRVHPKLKGVQKPTFGNFLNELLKNGYATPVCSEKLQCSLDEKEIIRDVMLRECCRDASTARKTAKTIRFLGLHEDVQIPEACSSAFDIVCLRMQERLSYSSKEQDMVLLHHEIQVEYPDGRPTETHKATLLEFGKIENGKNTTAMARTVGITVAIGTLLLLQNRIQTKGVIRPIDPEVYIPALEMLEACEIKLMEKIETS
ncbi:hypothetical protein HPP92_009326 [Vanilla planifolia]|uniref:Saccharopine dehydrogenase (NAD(+), L-glutamate-forming) n=1 Tax=Vanilla planifolia TaxID=51239 RepID=A0A835RFZ8_VANPL|nr:hypothetical protein HPP92_009326 [Vanilla planifolia]